MSKKITTTEYEYDDYGNVVKTTVTKTTEPPTPNITITNPYVYPDRITPGYPYVTYNTGVNTATSGGSIPGVETKGKPDDDLDEPQPFDDY